MAYQKPLCDCGKELNYEVDEIQVMTYRILKNGIISKKPIHKGLRTENNFGNLVCPSCQKRFEFNARIKGPNKFKATRGEEI